MGLANDTVHVGMLTLRLDLPGIRSLKEKRGIVKSLLQRVQQRFQVASAEVGYLDWWQTTSLGFAVIGNDTALLQSRLQQVVEFIAEDGRGVMVDFRVEMLA